ncbi:MAG TPA: DUF5947 family protein [Myxococcaceae bacterium]|nr:DUF5947 family protein [Myxococcaceae bacterium]
MSGGGLASLRRLRERPSADPEERCQLCANPIEETHPHLVRLDTRALLCSCPPCFLLFGQKGAGGGKFRAVPRRYVHQPLQLSLADWDALQIPVRMAFLFRNSSLGRIVAFYPSPAGATESLLSLEAWEEIESRTPLLQGMEPDVEALLVRGEPHGERLETFLVPIDACYELTGRVRRLWRGFDGGDEARGELARFFATLRARSEAAA